MVEVARGGTQPVADVAYRLALGKLAGQHRYQVRPAVIAFLVLVALMAVYYFFKLCTV